MAFVPVPQNKTAVPVLSLTDLTGERLVHTLQEFSCVFLTDLGPLSGLLESMLTASRAFFELPEQDKADVQWSGQGPWQGWQPVHASGPSAALLERFEAALPDPAGYPDQQSWAAEFAQWPATPPELSTTWAAYYEGMRGLASDLIRLIAGELELPEAELEAWTSRQHSNLCVNHYLKQEQPPEPGRVRSEPHTDIGGLTLLWADQTGGLQARIGPERSWVPVDFPAGAILLQAGDLLNLWSDRVIPANMHRVVNPERIPGAPQTDRYSVVFFHHPDLDAWVAPSHSEKRGVGARDHVLARQRRSYALAPESAAS
ncbi:MAG: 2OG-Fe(II) oxygenase [Frankiales bacterium]|nr:2OG-Fe(II) oxygenase [Frankiales bacterium]